VKRPLVQVEGLGTRTYEQVYLSSHPDALLKSERSTWGNPNRSPLSYLKYPSS